MESSFTGKLIKKYGNRKFYDTELSDYILVSDLYDLVKKEVPFKVIDNSTKNDITGEVLLSMLPKYTKLSAENALSLLTKGTL